MFSCGLRMSVAARQARGRGNGSHTFSRLPGLGDFRGQEPTGPVRSITEWLVLGLATAAQGNRVLPLRQRKLIAEMVNDLDEPLDDEGTIFATANDQRIGHG